MPLSVTVGLSQKSSRDFQSTGASIGLCADLDPLLLNDLAALQQKIRGLYHQARLALEAQLQPSAEAAPQPPAGPSADSGPVADGRGDDGPRNGESPGDPRNGHSGPGGGEPVGGSVGEPEGSRHLEHNARGNGAAAGSARRRNRESGSGPLTAAQSRMIAALAQRLGVDAERESRQVVGAPPAELTMRQASELIDHLRGLRTVRVLRPA